MTDLTAIKTPFGLLDRETQEALKAHGGPYEFWPSSSYSDDWGIAPNDADCWINRMIYRVKPTPPKPREWWLTSQVAHATEAKAVEFRRQLQSENPGMDFPPIVHVREVLE